MSTMSSNTADRQLVTVLLLLLGLVVVLPVLFVGVGGMGGPMMGGGTWGGHMWGDGATTPGWLVLAWLVLRLLFLAALVVGGYLVYRTLTRSEDGDPALEELRLAYARGDLTEEEYETRREALERNE
jgi:putative membrane protein